MREINPVNNNGSIQLKFSVSGKRYSLHPIPTGEYANRRDIETAKAIATRITNDVLAGNFDSSLERYRLIPKPELPKVDKPKTLLVIWDAWVSSLDLSAATKADHYEMVRRMLTKSDPRPVDTSWLTQADLAPSTYNKRLSYTRKCCDWAICKCWLEINPYAALKARKGGPKETKPFTTSEIQAILAGFEAVAPHYSPFVTFIFLTGVRLSEAIGLRWCHVDFSRGLVTICESLPVDRTGNGYLRILK